MIQSHTVCYGLYLHIKHLLCCVPGLMLICAFAKDKYCDSQLLEFLSVEFFRG